MRGFLILVVSFILFALALTGCGFEDEGRVALEGGQCATQLGTISIVPNDEEVSTYRVDAFCEDSQVRAGICPELWQALGRGITVEGVCFSDDSLAVVSLSLPQGGEIVSDEDVSFEVYPYSPDPEIAFEEGYSLERGTTLEKSGPVILRIRTLPRSEE